MIPLSHLIVLSFFNRMADVTYNTSSFPALLRTLSSLLALSDHRRQCVAGPDAHEPIAPGNGPLVLLAYKERDPGERQLWDMMVRETGVVLECVGKQAGAGGLPVEIWLGKKALTHLFTGHPKSQTAPRP
jgi:protein N-lysine methyltransferase METTL21D